MKVDDAHRNETRRDASSDRGRWLSNGRRGRTRLSRSTRAGDAVEFVTSSRPAVAVAVAVGGDDVRGRGSR